MKKNVFVVCILLISVNFAQAQLPFKLGFKAGLNASRFLGPAETDNAGNTLEKFSNNTGFLVGVNAGFPFNNIFGARVELQYSINGGRRLFESQNAYQKFTTIDSKPIVTTGYKRYNLNTFNSYIQLPVSLYAKLFKKIEISAGISPGFLISSTGTGEIKHVFSGTTTLKDNTLVQELDYNYGSDKIGSTAGNPVNFNLNTEAIATRSILNAYENFTEKSGGYYESFDLGALLGLAYYFNSSLYLGANMYYGLKDVSRETYDISLQKLDAGNFIKRNDFDRNFALQFMLGFQF